MRVTLAPARNNEFVVDTWTSTSPQEIVTLLAQQLCAASAIWPELSRWKILDCNESDQEVIDRLMQKEKP